MTDRDLMQMALDALEPATRPIEEAAIQALRDRLAQPEPEPVAYRYFREIYEIWAGSEGIPLPKTCTEGYLLQLIEQMRDIAKEGLKYTRPLNEQPTCQENRHVADSVAPPETEPVAWVNEIQSAIPNYKELAWEKDKQAIKSTPLYTAPPKREWVGLTDDEIYEYADKFLYQHGSNYGIKSFGKAIEAKLKEKNT